VSVPDPRTTLARAGVAASGLEGAAPAARYVAPTPRQVAVPALGLMREPRAGSEQMDQLLFGERFDVLDTRDGWAFGQAERDGYVGWTALDGLGETLAAPTHWVCALGAHAFSEPSIKTRPLHRLSMNALVAVEEAEEGRFLRIAGSGWIVREHLRPLGAWAQEPAAVAERYLGVPYLWGGRDSLGLDCSGLVQQALYACGHAAPRDTDLQAALGEATDGALGRNDLVFWRGHVGMMLDAGRLLHANAHHMAVAIEPLAEAVARIEAGGGGPPTALRRIGVFAP
jgi:cell wall-associated NlpC family hydrolase